MWLHLQARKDDCCTLSCPVVRTRVEKRDVREGCLCVGGRRRAQRLLSLPF
uniref:Uncharacterized protein n=1 Tax=Solanum lycopersicum TaxID=4081 RepID=A0A3Q7ICZ3_SOLLC